MDFEDSRVSKLGDSGASEKLWLFYWYVTCKLRKEKKK